MSHDDDKGGLVDMVTTDHSLEEDKITSKVFKYKDIDSIPSDKSYQELKKAVQDFCVQQISKKETLRTEMDRIDHWLANYRFLYQLWGTRWVFTGTVLLFIAQAYPSVQSLFNITLPYSDGVTTGAFILMSLSFFLGALFLLIPLEKRRILNKIRSNYLNGI